MKKRHFFLITIIVLLLGSMLVISGCNPKPETSDFQVAKFDYVNPEYIHDRSVEFDATNKIIILSPVLTISLNKKMYLRFYDVIHDKTLYTGTGIDYQLYELGNNQINIRGLYLDYLGQQPKIEICGSTEYFTDKNSPKVLCKTESLQALNIDVSITPDPITFEASKNNYSGKLTKEITITNTGNTPLAFFIDLGNPLPKNANYLLYNYDIISKIYLLPGERKSVTINMEFGNPTNGVHESTGYVIAIGASNTFASNLEGYNEDFFKFKKPFKLRTTIN